MSARHLVVLLEGVSVGQVFSDNRGRLRFVYEESWRLAADAYPLSLSMPLGLAEHTHTIVDAFLWGLLPDNALVLDSWGRQFQVSPRNPFTLLQNVGEDCAGAAQFVRPERLEALHAKKTENVEWLSERGVAERLRTLRSDHSAWRLERDTGQFSLAGAQPKTALLLEKGRWGIPSGRTPTTHILKPPAGQFRAFIENEYLCLQLASRLGFPMANSRIVRFEDETALVIERFDRVHTAKGWVRIHQEDLCQASGIPPTRKYQSEGGPSVEDIVAILRAHSTSANDDVITFIDAVAFNWLIAGTDAHAKNYGILIGPARVRLAPLYDIASILPYPQFDLNRVKLAMKVAERYRARDIGRREWLKVARQLGLNADVLMERIGRMAEAIVDLAPEIGSEMNGAGLASTTVDRLVTRLVGRARWGLARLGI